MLSSNVGDCNIGDSIGEGSGDDDKDVLIERGGNRMLGTEMPLLVPTRSRRTHSAGEGCGVDDDNGLLTLMGENLPPPEPARSRRTRFSISEVERNSD